jgi:hypothetical protein
VILFLGNIRDFEYRNKKWLNEIQVDAITARCTLELEGNVQEGSPRWILREKDFGSVVMAGTTDEMEALWTSKLQPTPSTARVLPDQWRARDSPRMLLGKFDEIADDSDSDEFNTAPSSKNDIPGHPLQSSSLSDTQNTVETMKATSSTPSSSDLTPSTAAAQPQNSSATSTSENSSFSSEGPSISPSAVDLSETVPKLGESISNHSASPIADGPIPSDVNNTNDITEGEACTADSDNILTVF